MIAHGHSAESQSASGNAVLLDVIGNDACFSAIVGATS